MPNRSLNQEIADQAVADKVRLLRYEAGIVGDVVDRYSDWIEPIVDDTKRILTLRRARARAGLSPTLLPIEQRILTNHLRDIANARAVLEADLRETLARAITESAEVEAEQAIDRIIGALPEREGLDAVVSRLTTADAAAIALDPLGGDVWTNRLAADLVAAQTQIEGVITASVSSGLSVPNAARLLKEVASIPQTYKGRLIAIARTEIQRASNTAAMASYHQNEGIVGGVIYLATLDSRTCLVCAPRHGVVYPIRNGQVITPDGAPQWIRPPIHPRCRCFPAPQTKPWKDLGVNISEANRSKMTGQPAVGQSFDQWLRGQPRKTQEKILGPTRARLWRGRRCSLRDFSVRSDPLTLGELARKKDVDI